MHKGSRNYKYNINEGRVAAFWSTSCFLRRRTTIQSHDYRSKHHVSLYSVLPDSINDGVREFHVKVKEENNAVFILKKNKGGTGEKILSITSSLSFILQYSL